MTVMECFGARLKATRQRQGLTQYRLASLAGVPQGTISRVESGGQQSITVELARRLAKALRVDVDYLCGTHDPDVERRSAPEQTEVSA